MNDHLVVIQLKSVLEETGNLLIHKWNFDPETHEAYITKIINRFKNKHISDAITRVARTPIRKLGNQERFVRPALELTERHLSAAHLFETIGIVFNYDDPNDEQSRQLHQLLVEKELPEVITEVTGITDKDLVEVIDKNVKKYAFRA